MVGAGGRSGTFNVKQLDSFGDRDFNLHNIILNPVNDIFINAHFIGKSMEVQLMLSCKSKDFLIPLWNSVPRPFMESPQVFSAGHDVQTGLIGKERDFNEKFGIIVKTAVQQAVNGDHGTIRGLMETPKLVFFRFAT